MSSPTSAASPSAPDAASPPSRWRRVGRCALSALPLLLITAAGGLLRFYQLDQPVLWGDEVMTYSRVTGTFEQLMDILDEQGFVPLHYIAYWALGKVTLLTPAAMRLIPAAAGTLFIPAVYFLARQMVDRRTSLLAAAFAAVSAWSLIYSRDAKMYMHTWLFVTLLVALMLHWLRTKRWWSYLLLIVSGALAVMLHATALIVVALLPALLISPPGRLRKRDPVYVVLAAAFILAGPAWYYLYYNKYIARTAIVPARTSADEEVEEVRSGNTGLSWVEDFNAGIGPAEQVLNSATGYLLGLQWPRRQIDPKPFDRELEPWFPPAVTAAMSVTLGLLALGALPWPRRWRGRPHDASDPDLPRPPPFDTVDHGQARRGWFARSRPPWAPPREAQPWPRTLLWLTVWIVLPAYGVYYCRSYPDFVSPWSLLGGAWAWLGWWWLAAAALAAGFAVLMRGSRSAAVAAAIVLGLLVLGLAAAAGATAGTHWLLAFERWLSQWWLGVPVAALALALLWRQAGSDTRQRLRNIRRLAVVAGIVFLLCLAMYYLWQHLWDQHRQKHGEVLWESIWMPRYLGVVFPAVVVGVAALLRRLPTAPLRVTAIAIVLALNLTQGVARIAVDTEPPLDRIAADVLRGRDDPGVLTAVGLREQPGVRRDWFASHRPGYYTSYRGYYYLSTAAGYVGTPADFRRGTIRREFDYPVGLPAAALARQANTDPRLQQLVLWERFTTRVPFDTSDDALLPALGSGWELTSDDRFHTRQFWTWRHGDWHRRRVYTKQNNADL